MRVRGQEARRRRPAAEREPERPLTDDDEAGVGEDGQTLRRIRELETELEIAKKASALFAAGEVSPKGSTR